jgi:hypothetical protein
MQKIGNYKRGKKLYQYLHGGVLQASKFQGYVWKKFQHCSLLKLFIAVLMQTSLPFSFVLLWCRRHKMPS